MKYFWEKFQSKRNETKTIKNREIFSLSWGGTIAAVTGCGNQLHFAAVVISVDCSSYLKPLTNDINTTRLAFSSIHFLILSWCPRLLTQMEIRLVSHRSVQSLTQILHLVRSFSHTFYTKSVNWISGHLRAEPLSWFSMCWL